MRWTSRKFWAMVVFEFTFVTMRVHDVLSMDAFVVLSQLLLGGYFVANVAGSGISAAIEAVAKRLGGSK